MTRTISRSKKQCGSQDSMKRRNKSLQTLAKAMFPTSASNGDARGHGPPDYPGARRRSPIGPAWPRRSRCFPSKQALRAPKQDQNCQGVDEDRAALGQIKFEDKIKHAQKQRSVVDADHAAEPADGNHNQKIDQIFERILRVETEKLGAQPTAKPGHPAAESESDGEQPVDIDAQRLRHSPIVDRRADLRADPGSFERKPDSVNDEKPDCNQK